MKLYAGTTEQFRADARMHRIAEKLRAEYTAQIGYRPPPSEEARWQIGVVALSNDRDVSHGHQLGSEAG